MQDIKVETLKSAELKFHPERNLCSKRTTEGRRQTMARWLRAEGRVSVAVTLEKMKRNEWSRTAPLRCSQTLGFSQMKTILKTLANVLWNPFGPLPFPTCPSPFKSPKNFFHLKHIFSFVNKLTYLFLSLKILLTFCFFFIYHSFVYIS